MIMLFYLVFDSVVSAVNTPRTWAVDDHDYNKKLVKPQSLSPWNGQQYVSVGDTGDLYDVEYDPSHSGFRGNANYKAPPFIAGISTPQ
jgi:hypothetical protein